MNVDKALDGIVDAKLSIRGDQISDGNYLFAVKKIHFIEGGYKGDSMVFEFVVLTASEISIPPDLLRVGEAPGMAKPNAVGTIVSTVNNLSKPGEAQKAAFSACKAIFAGLLNWTPEQLADNATLKATLKAAIAADQPYVGFPISCSTYRAKTRNQSAIHTRYNWRHYPASPEELAKCRALVLSKG